MNYYFDIIVPVKVTGAKDLKEAKKELKDWHGQHAQMSSCGISYELKMNDFKIRKRKTK